MALADLIYGIMTTQFDMQFLEHTENNPDGGDADFDSLANLMRGADTPLTMAFKKYAKALAGQAIKIDVPDGDSPGQPLAARMPAIGGLVEILEGEDAELATLQQEKRQLYDKILADMRTR